MESPFPTGSIESQKFIKYLLGRRLEAIRTLTIASDPMAIYRLQGQIREIDEQIFDLAQVDSSEIDSAGQITAN